MQFDVESLLSSPRERVGFVLKSGEIVEVENICPHPEEGFEVKTEDLVRYLDEATASWHTHPGKDAGASHADFLTFRSYPELEHYIIGTDGVRKYRVDGNSVIQACVSS